MKKYFVSLRKIEPTAMEGYLEDMAEQGYELKPLGESGFFSFEFDEAEKKKVRFVVDITAMDKAAYFQNALDAGWEYMGKTGNCYVWRQEYEEKRPKNFADKVCRQRHCFRMGIGFGIAAFILFSAAIAFIWGCLYEHKFGIHDHIFMYITEAIFELAIAAYFAWGAKRLLDKS